MTRIDLLDSSRSRRLLRNAFRRAHSDGWVAHRPNNRRDGGWSWVNPGWPRNTRPPANARRVSWDGVNLTVQVVNADPLGWVTVLWGRPTSVRQAIWMLVAAGVLPEAVTR